MVSRRNLLILLTHGLRSDALGDGRAWPLMTPNLQKVIARSARLVAISACPADPGGMTCLLTGLHARQHGQFDGPIQSLPDGNWVQGLADNGYHTVGVGCVSSLAGDLDLATVVADVGSADVARCAYLRAMADKNQHEAILSQRRQRRRSGPFDPERTLLHPDDDIDGFIIAQARMRLEAMPTDRPWALIVVFSGPGNDLPPPLMYGDIANPSDLESGFALADLRDVESLAELDYPLVMLQRLEPRQIGRIRADYLGRVSLLDFGIGRMTAALAGRSDADRTWMILAGDHGQVLGEHGLVGHRSFLCGAVEVPLVIMPPTVTKQRLFDTTSVSTVDVAATIAALGGCDPPPGSPGRSLLPLLGGEPVTSGSAGLAGGAISELGRRIMLETERHKVIFETDTHRAIGLYDLLDDPDERDNLVAKPRGHDILDALRWRLANALMPLRAIPPGAAFTARAI